METTVHMKNATMVNMKLDLEQRLKLAMKHANLTVADLQRKTGLTYQGIKKIYDGKTKDITLNSAAELASALECSKYWLALGEGEPGFTVNESEAQEQSPTTRTASPANLHHARAGRRPAWPFPGIDETKIHNLDEADRMRLDGILLDAALRLGFDVRADPVNTGDEGKRATG